MLSREETETETFIRMTGANMKISQRQVSSVNQYFRTHLIKFIIHSGTLIDVSSLVLIKVFCFYCEIKLMALVLYFFCEL